MRREEDTGAAPEAESEPVPSPDPSDPDAAMYEAMRARPDWLEKPVVRRLLEELSEGLRPGEDLFYWDVSPPRPVQPSSAEEHRIVTLPARPESLVDTLPSARVIVQEPPISRPSPGRNGPRRLDAPADAGTELLRPQDPRAVHRGVSLRWLVPLLLGAALLAVAITLGVLEMQ